MLKRVVSRLLLLFIMITGILFSEQYVAYADVNMQISEISIHDSINTAKLIAASFVAEEINSNVESGWSHDSDVSGEATIVYNTDDSILGYMFPIFNNNIENGYILISSESKGFSVIEYAYEKNNVSRFVIEGNSGARNIGMTERIYLSGALEYIAESEYGDYVSCHGERVDIKSEPRFEFDANASEINKAKNIVKFVSQYTDLEIDQAFEIIKSGNSGENTSGGIISDPKTYLANVISSQCTYTIDFGNSNVLSGAGNLTCNQLGGHNNCTLTALYNAMVYYRDVKRYSKISSSQKGLYDVIKDEATALGYDYDNSVGLNVTKNNNLVNNVFERFGYPTVAGFNNYAWNSLSVKSAIDNNGPFLFSLASGVYFDHTVMVYGYRTYQNSIVSSEKYLFWVIRDGWDNHARYLSMFGGGGGPYLGCMTSILAD